MSKKRLQGVWIVFGTCLKHVWNVFGKCVEGLSNVRKGVLKVSEVFLKVFVYQNYFDSKLSSCSNYFSDLNCFTKNIF